jgi:nitrogen fixation protein FixH
VTRRFTGWHMTAIMVGFFGVVVAVNLTMATLASRTFGGTVVDNSYVASQNFNRWLAEARDQAALGWTATVERRGDDRLGIALASSAGPLEGARVGAVAHHPLGRAPDVALAFVAQGGGLYLSSEPLPAGRWSVRLDIAHRGDEARFVRDLAR